MRVVPARPVWLSMLALAVSFVGGATLGAGLGQALAPDSNLATVVTFLMLPTALIAGFHAWLGMAILALLMRWLRSGRRIPIVRGGSDTTVVPPGSWVFLPVGIGAGLAGGVLTGVLSSEAAIWSSAAACAVVGAAYGALLHGLARSGYLPFPTGD